jgi:4-azaleucine resistance transporter AzlC
LSNILQSCRGPAGYFHEMTEARISHHGCAPQPSRPDRGNHALHEFLRGCRKCLPLGAGVATYGLVFGVLARQAGLGVAEVALMSGLVFAGSAQFVVLALWAPALPILAIASATVIVNLRYVLMAAVLRDLFRDAARLTALSAIFLLCDESWALTMGEKAQGRGSISFLAGSGIVVYLAWVSSTIAGRLIGQEIGDPTKWGVDFAFTATFLALLVGMSRGRSDILPWSVAAAVATLVSVCLPGIWHIVIGGMAGATVGSLRRAV